MVMSLVWQVFEPLLFGLVGAEVSVEYMNSKVVGVLRFPLFLFFLFSFCYSYCSFLGGGGGGLKWQAFNLEIKHEQCCCYKKQLYHYMYSIFELSVRWVARLLRNALLPGIS